MILNYTYLVFIFLTNWKYHNCEKNVLLVIMDDARPTLGCYGNEKFITPNLDQLASKSVLFENAHAQQALCGPSRTSFLTGRRPDTTNIIDSHHYWRKWAGNFTTLPQYFKNRGYHTVSTGKVFHPGKASGRTDDYPYSWSEKPFHPSTYAYKMAKVCPTPHGKLQMNIVCPVSLSKMPEKTLPDIQTTNFALNFLKNWKDSNSQKPFFLAVGYDKPHIPLKYPEKYRDLYPLSQIHLAHHHTKPVAMPTVAWNPWADLRRRDDVKLLNVSFPYGPLPDHYQLRVRQSYFATVTYVDDLIGELLSTLDTRGYANDTIILLTSDHGWALGENQEWSKYSLFEVATRVPLLVHVPGLTAHKGRRGSMFPHIDPFHPHLNVTLNKPRDNQRDFIKPDVDSTLRYSERVKRTTALVELVDVFPTLADLAGIPVPKLCPPRSSQIPLCTEGVSFAPVVRRASHSAAPVSWKRAVFSVYPRPSVEPRQNSDQCRRRDARILGHTMRTSCYRYTEWIAFDHVKLVANWSHVYAREFYIHRHDPEENNNVAGRQEYKQLISRMSRWLREGWRHALPPIKSEKYITQHIDSSPNGILYLFVFIVRFIWYLH